MKLNPLSWFSDIADELGIPVWAIWAAVIVAGLFILVGPCSGGGAPCNWNQRN